MLFSCVLVTLLSVVVVSGHVFPGVSGDVGGVPARLLVREVLAHRGVVMLVLC